MTARRYDGIALWGEWRDPPNENDVARVVLMLARQMLDERDFLTWLFSQDNHVTGLSREHLSVLGHNSLSFGLLDTGRLACLLPKASYEEALASVDGARLYRGAHAAWRNWLLLPTSTRLDEKKRYALEALNYAKTRSQRIS